MNLREATRLVQLKIRDAAKEEDLAQAKELTGYVMGIAPGALALHGDMELSGVQLEELGALSERRAAGEPLQYILGGWDFMGLPFILEPGVLIPRQDTEVLCEKAEKLICGRCYGTILDLCCGSGCIGIALAKRTGIAATLSDNSPDCVRICRENAALNQVSCTVLEGDLFQPVQDQTFDLICVNPPYLTATDMKQLQPEVGYEPESALYGGIDGLSYYRKIAREYKKHLRPGGALLMEIGASQGEAVLELFGCGEVFKDYGGNDRVVIVEDVCLKS